MASYAWITLAALALPAKPAAAQQPPPRYDYRLVESDQELDYARFEGIHCISARVRGVRGEDSTLYWVSADYKHLTAYKYGRQLWQINVAQAFTDVLPGARIDKLIFASYVVFVMTNGGGHAEVDRATGKISAVGVGN